MFFVSALVSVLLFGLGVLAVSASPAAVKAQCKTIRSGPLSTNDFADKSGNIVIKPCYFNSEKYVAYDSTKKHPTIQAQFQNCTPNYAREGNQDEGQELYGRFYIPSKKECLAVTNPSGNPPYYVSYKTCPSAADMATKKSIPFNFVWDGTGGEIDIRWAGATIPSKSIWQGPNPPAKYCRGQYFVNSTNLQSGHNTLALGQPNSAKSENYKIHLYCPNTRTGGTAYNSFTLPNFGTKDFVPI